MGKIFNNNICEFCIEPYNIIDLPDIDKSIIDYIIKNNVNIYMCDGEPLEDEINIEVSNYLIVHLDKKIVTEYLIHYSHIKSEDELDEYLSSIYITYDFDNLIYYLSDFYSNVKIDVINKDVILKEIKSQIK